MKWPHIFHDWQGMDRIRDFQRRRCRVCGRIEVHAFGVWIDL